MAACEQLAAWLRLTLIPGIGGESQRRLLAALGSPESVFATSASILQELLGETLTQRILHPGNEIDEKIEAQIAAAIAWVSEPGNRIITLADSEYPQALLSSNNPPVLLYVKGRVELLNRPALAIVGSRNATPQGEADAQAFAAALAGNGYTIVSGLALGIDAAAHRGALSNPADPACGSTIAVIGTGADRVYPARNRELAVAIAEHGVIVSEFPLNTPALATNFPRRNRIIAGLAQGCLVVQAAPQSGSLITARLAAEAGREVFAVPGSIHSPFSRGCHSLIKQGAKLVESAQDILEELRWESRISPASTVVPNDEKPMESQDDTAPLLAALGHDPCDVDTLAGRTGLAPEMLLAMLVQLELEGRVSSLPGGRYQSLQHH